MYGNTTPACAVQNRYLTRYRTDRASSNKKAVSLEGRTAETEAIHDSFMIGRAELRPAMAEGLEPGWLRSRS